MAKRPGYQGQQWGGWHGPNQGFKPKPNAGVTWTTPPFDAQLEATRARGEQRRTTLLSDLSTDVTAGAQEFGFKFDPNTGAFGGFDPSNPFSQAALLAKARETGLRSNTNALASRGQLYSGAKGAADRATQFGYDKGYNTLRNQFTQFVTNYIRRRRDITQTPSEELPNLI